MAAKAANTAEVTDNREDASDGPLVDSMVQAVKKMIARGKERGYVTYDELNAILPQGQVSSEQIEDTMTTLSELGINVIEGEETEEAAPAVADEEGESKPNGNLDDEDIGRTDDPVRMYLREMGSVELLSREGEIAIAKRIEAGREMMIRGICESPLTIRAVVGWRDAILEGRMLLREVIDLDATYGSSAFESGEVPPDAELAAAEAEAEGEEPEVENVPELSAEMNGDMEGEGEEGSVSLAKMEEAVKPQLLATFENIAEIWKKLGKLQEQRLATLNKGDAVATVTERRYEKLKADVLEAMQNVRINNLKLEGLVEQLYDLNRRLMGMEGQAGQAGRDFRRQAPGFHQPLSGFRTHPAVDRAEA